MKARVIEQFHIGLRTLAFDAANFDTFIDTKADSELAHRGHAKSKRTGMRIIGLAFLVSIGFNMTVCYS